MDYQNTTANDILLKSITELLGMNFYIPEYQRGYRWTPHNVRQLLDDIWEYRTKGSVNSFYCLQPVVVKKSTWQDSQGQTVEGYELIDGQQRLTTLHRILTYLMLEHLKTESLSEDYGQERYHIYYKTRPESKDFLQGKIYDATKPDLFYLSEAYRTIKHWFEDPDRGFVRADKNKFLDILLPSAHDAEWSVKVIWYELQDGGPGRPSQNSKELFTRLNRGKLPLTAAELIKAKLLNSKSFGQKTPEEQIKRKTEIVQIWDEIESGLNEPRFWAFATNRPTAFYSSKIELLFDILTGKKEHEPDPLYSFIHFFDEDETAESLWQKWIEVEEVYRSLRYWFSDKNMYHKIGYLIATGTSVRELIRLRRNERKRDFESALDELIAKKLPADWDDLQFNRPGDYDKIGRVLLLHNLEIIRKNHSLNEFFSFETYKRITGSLEHIHAQNVEDIDPNKKEQWLEWLKEHILLLKEKSADDEVIQTLIQETEQSYETLTFQLFKSLSQRILPHFNEDEVGGHEFMHRIENLALLGLSENIVLSNSVFEVKRRRITAMDKRGEFIPPATKRVFLKYYSDEHQPAYTLWTVSDRNHYLDDIRRHLMPYLGEKAESETIAAAHED
ncbi:MAG: DUF262 domain-containing protein [Methylobacter sp.]|uniref:DUF262 domain-containing protein n=1 Tax=Methylobacter sp. TaxID=2051955 RepID=UPI0025EF4E56|nr:DUF262 domain-containing protein [Methylobacter sp.]MCK9619129.1 DUF262 domain-containing protein [Methylobacter sp.]